MVCPDSCQYWCGCDDYVPSLLGSAFGLRDAWMGGVLHHPAGQCGLAQQRIYDEAVGEDEVAHHLFWAIFIFDSSCGTSLCRAQVGRAESGPSAHRQEITFIYIRYGRQTAEGHPQVRGHTVLAPCSAPSLRIPLLWEDLNYNGYWRFLIIRPHNCTNMDR